MRRCLQPPPSHRTMKRLNISDYNIVKYGQHCQITSPLEQVDMAKLLERRESDIWWLQPRSSNASVSDQIAAVKINEEYYSMSLKIEKAVFRQFRLSRNFNNIEYLEDGTAKLRIPVRLLREKLRTSNRHMVRHPTPPLKLYYKNTYIYLVLFFQAMTKFKKKKEASGAPSTRKRKCHVKVDLQAIDFHTFINQLEGYADPKDHIILSSTPQNMIQQFRQLFQSQFPALDFDRCLGEKTKIPETATLPHSLALPQT